LHLQGTPWFEAWEEKERRENVVVWRYVFLFAAIAYVAHYYLLDKPMGLQPEATWFVYRMSLAALSLLTFAFYLVRPLYESKLYRAPVYLTCWAIAYGQARSMVWFEDTLYLYAFAFVVLGGVLLRTSLFKSLCFAALALVSQWPSFMATNLSRSLIYSAAAISLVFVYISRSKYQHDIRHFLAVQESIQAQKQVIELTIEFSDRIRALLPREISQRLTFYLSQQGLTVLQAIDEVLRPRKKTICCLYSDIRGFTQGTKDLDRFVGHGVIPNVKQCTSVIESNHGIPRKIGDLIFAYFDDQNNYVNILRSLKAGIDIANVNESFNQSNPEGVTIRRHILIASGEAIVGNLGGFDSSLEITALGSPVNLLSRLDELTKTRELQDYLRNPSLILCSNVATHIRELELGLKLQRVCLRSLGLHVRDFEEVDELWLMDIDEHSASILTRSIEYVGTTYHDQTELIN
jgi:class 3 adenylate cyclase